MWGDVANIVHNNFPCMMMKRSVSSAKKKKVAARSKWMCARCCEIVDEHYEIDHVTPLHMGGTNCLTNLQLRCTLCHVKKTAGEREHKAALKNITCGLCVRVYSPYFNHACSKLQKRYVYTIKGTTLLRWIKRRRRGLNV